MSTNPAQPAGTPPARRVKKRLLIPAAVLGVLAVLVLWAYVRGTWADREPRNPLSSAEGVLTQLYLAPEGRKQVRCAVILDYPPRKVWEVITDYEHFAEIFPTVSRAEVTREPDGRYHWVGTVTSPVGGYPIDIHIRHEERPGQFEASWDGPTGSVTVNRGSWTVTPMGQGRTLLVYSLEAEIAPFPNFVVRNVQLSREMEVVGAVADWLRKHDPQ
jgi:uncharacterized protein YndB with AHSA1/START domain